MFLLTEIISISHKFGDAEFEVVVVGFVTEILPEFPVFVGIEDVLLDLRDLFIDLPERIDLPEFDDLDKIG